MSKTSIKAVVNSSMTNCKEATMLIVKHEQNCLTLVEKLKMYVHVFIVCKFCRLFYRQSKAINWKLKRTLSDNSAEIIYHLNDDDKSELQALINKEIGSR